MKALVIGTLLVQNLDAQVLNDLFDVATTSISESPLVISSSSVSISATISGADPLSTSLKAPIPVVAVDPSAAVSESAVPAVVVDLSATVSEPVVPVPVIDVLAISSQISLSEALATSSGVVVLGPPATISDALPIDPVITIPDPFAAVEPLPTSSEAPVAAFDPLETASKPLAAFDALATSSKTPTVSDPLATASNSTGPIAAFDPFATIPSSAVPEANFDALPTASASNNSLVGAVPVDVFASTSIEVDATTTFSPSVVDADSTSTTSSNISLPGFEFPASGPSVVRSSVESIPTLPPGPPLDEFPELDAFPTSSSNVGLGGIGGLGALSTSSNIPSTSPTTVIPSLGPFNSPSGTPFDDVFDFTIIPAVSSEAGLPPTSSEYWSPRSTIIASFAAEEPSTRPLLFGTNDVILSTLAPETSIIPEVDEDGVRFGSLSSTTAAAGNFFNDLFGSRPTSAFFPEASAPAGVGFDTGVFEPIPTTSASPPVFSATFNDNLFAPALSSAFPPQLAPIIEPGPPVPGWGNGKGFGGFSSGGEEAPSPFSDTPSSFGAKYGPGNPKPHIGPDGWEGEDVGWYDGEDFNYDWDEYHSWGKHKDHGKGKGKGHDLDPDHGPGYGSGTESDEEGCWKNDKKSSGKGKGGKNNGYCGGKRPDKGEDSDSGSEGEGYGKKKKQTGGKKGNGKGYYPNSDSDTDYECPKWCLNSYSDSELDSDSEWDSNVPVYGKKSHKKSQKGGWKKKWRRSVVKRAPEPPSSGGFKGFQWPKKNNPRPGPPFPYEELTPYPYDSPHDQNTDYGDDGEDDLPDWLKELRNNKIGGKKGKKKGKKNKGKCPKKCQHHRKPYGNGKGKGKGKGKAKPIEDKTPEDDLITYLTLGNEISTTNNVGASSAVYAALPPIPSTFITSKTSDSSSTAPTEDSAVSPISGTLADVCPTTCNPFNPTENKCDPATTGCTTTGGTKYYCACRAGYRYDGVVPSDFTQQFRVDGQPYVYGVPGKPCNTRCDQDWCDEVPVRPACK